MKKIALMVAEKPSVAKAIQEFLGAGKSVKKFQGKSKFNPLYEIDYLLNGEEYTLRITSVLGHIMGLKYPDTCKNWQTTNIHTLFIVPLEKIPIASSRQVVKNLEFYSKDISALVLWLDCDREGEAIAFDVIDVCQKQKKNLEIFRAHFSALTSQNIKQAMSSLTPPNKAQSDAVKVRQEVDLRIGASFTRFQTLNLRSILGNQNKQVLSYGPCQFPTLGFIVERYQQIKDHKPEPFWRLKMVYNGSEFTWSRARVYCEETCLLLKESCDDCKVATVTEVTQKQTKKYRPFPLNTIEAQKLISRKLKISPAYCMSIMEKLYNRGYLSYPRTETTKYNQSIDLKEIVSGLEKSEVFGQYAGSILQKWNGPKSGNRDDKAHPPIHPVKLAHQKELGRQEWLIYDILTRHFLASLSKDAIGNEKTVKVQMGGESFSCSGVQVEQTNFLDIYPYDSWSEKKAPNLNKNDQIKPILSMDSGHTQAPSPLTEADLITKMDTNGIGTDATIHEHIKTVQERGYACKQGNYIVPKQLGVSLVETYQKIGIDLYKPYLRAQMEKDMELIAAGQKTKEQALTDCITAMVQIYRQTDNKRLHIQEVFQGIMAQSFEGPAPKQKKRGGAGYFKGEPMEIEQQNDEETKQMFNPLLQGKDNAEARIQNNPLLEATTDESATQQEKEEEKAPPLFEICKGTEFTCCPQCRKFPLRIKSTKHDTLFVSCTGYPECKTAMPMPKGIRTLQILNDLKCSKCWNMRKREVSQFRITFDKEIINEGMAEALPENNNTSGVFCVFQGCDDNLEYLNHNSKNLTLKRSYQEANLNQNVNNVAFYNSNVPNYYYQKPDNEGLCQKTIKPLQASESSVTLTNSTFNQKKVAGKPREGCPQCNKKRHVKTSTCPMNPYKPQTKTE